ncbi:MAG: hypothetical protein NTY22_00570 [Proteobacteria bacterium]|nr:hypothetical protein [Pseudomonadota bacterium]
MTPDKKMVQDYELDLVALLGVIIKRRKFIIYFVMLLTFISILFLCFRERRNAITIEKTYKLENSVSTDKDAILATYMVLKKGKDNEIQGEKEKEKEKQEYKKFLRMILFPSKIDTPDFEILNKKNQVASTYLFNTEAEAKNFMNRYNSFVNLLGKIGEYKVKLSDEAFSNCRQFDNSIKGTILQRNLFLFFRNPEDIKICNLFNYYYAEVQNKITYASTDNTTISEASIPFIIDFINGEPEKSKLIPTIRTGEDINEIKIKMKSNFNVRKIIKYSISALVMFGILSIFMVFLMEFWKNNKTRLSKYWRE